MVITGVFAKGDTQQTLWGLFGGLLFWTGWIEFIYVYYAHRFGVQPLIVDGEVVTKPEYLIMPSSFGFWIMFMLLYLFNIKSGCDFFNYLQRKEEIAPYRCICMGMRAFSGLPATIQVVGHSRIW